MSSNRNLRPSPSRSAAVSNVGDILVGNDGSKWIVSITSTGIKRWVRLPVQQSPTVSPVVHSSGDMSDKHQPIIKTKTMSKKKKYLTEEVRKIETSLINKDQVFRMLALAESTGLPCLLVGPPGVGKTKTVLDYAKAWLNRDGKLSMKEFAEKIYILETDEGTKPSEIKGTPDIEKLFSENRLEMNTPISEAEIVVINEVDKASPAIRNAMLGVMNEKFLFNGKHKIPCKWKLFIATCNEIPKEEKDNPFWDRFMLKMTVGRVTAGEIVRYYENGDRNYRETIELNIPNQDEMNSLDISAGKLSRYVDVAYSQSSDRTLTFVPRIARAVSYIWKYDVDKALVKTAQIMINQSAGSELQDKLMSKEKKSIVNQIDMLRSYTTNEQLEKAVTNIETTIATLLSNSQLDNIDVEDLESMLQDELEKHSAHKKVDEDEFLSKMEVKSNTPIVETESVCPF